MADPNVTERSYPFASGQGTTVTEDDWAAMADTWQDDGVSAGLTVVPGPTQNTVQINPGLAAVQGFTYRLTAPKIMSTLTNPDTVNRLDLVVLLLDKAGEQITPVVRASTPVSAVAANEIPLSIWSQLPSTSATASNWGSASDARWFQGSRVRPALATAQPPAALGALMYLPSAGPQGTLYIGTAGAGGTPVWTAWTPAQGALSVKDFGAIGDGVNDDAPALQAALDAVANTAPGHRLSFPPGTYLVNSELEIKGAIHLDLAEGATIKRGSASMQYILKNFNSTYAPTLYAGRGNIIVSGGTIDADGFNLTGSVTSLIFAHAKDVTVEGVTFRNVRDWHAIELNSVKDGKVRDCTFEGFLAVATGRTISEAVQIDLAIDASALPGIGAGALDDTPCDNILVTGCTVRAFGSLGSYGRLVGSHSFVDNVFHRKIHVIGNHGEGLNDYLVRGFNWVDAVVQGNTCTASNGGVRFEVPTGATIESESIVVSGNTFRGMGVQNNGLAVLNAVISIFGLVSPSVPVREATITGNIIKTFANPTGIESINVADVVIVGNVVKAGTGTGAVGVDVAASANAIVEGNKIDAMAVGVKTRDATVSGAGVAVTGNSINACTSTALQGDGPGTTFVANRVRACGSATKASVELNAAYCMFTSNYMWKSSGTAAKALVLTANAVGATIAANVFRGWGTTSGSAAQADVMTDSNTATLDGATTFSTTEKYISSVNN